MASDNPWEVGTLEWMTPSPPPHHNFDKIPTVYNGPHEFSHPKVTKKDWIEITTETFNKVFKNSAVKRTKIKGFKRNISFLD